MPTPKHAPAPDQLPLIHFVQSEDLYLQERPEALWLRALRKIDGHNWQQAAARYYEHLWQFNQKQSQRAQTTPGQPTATQPGNRP